MKKIVGLLCLMLCYNLALAEDYGFNAMDSDKDGLVNLNEFTSAKPTLHTAAFEAIDLNTDGWLDFEEWKSFSLAHGKTGEIPPTMQSKVKARGTMPPKDPTAPMMPNMTSPSVANPIPPKLPVVTPPKAPSENK